MLSLAHLLHSVRWVLPATFLLGTAPTFFIVWTGWRFVTLLLPASVYEAGDDFLYSLYQRLVLFFYEHYNGTEVILSGDVDKMVAEKENVILIMNHQCAVDWMVADMLAVRQGSIGHIRYILKDELRYFPMYGFYFRQHSCIYVKRGSQFKQDKATRQLDAIAQNKTPFWMVIFPEGTRYSPDSKDKMSKSQQYAKNQGLPILEEHLTPRPKAFHLCTDRLRQSTAAVYDVTVAYAGSTDSNGKRTSAPGLIDLLAGKCQKIHLNVERIPLRDVPKEEAETRVWLHQRFVLKDKLMQRFYSSDPAVSGSLSDSYRVSPLSLTHTVPAFLFWLGLSIPLFGTVAGRAFYWRLALFGIAAGWAWISVRF